MPRQATNRTARFAIYYGLAASLALHAILGLPFIQWRPAVDDDSPPLVVDLQGLITDTQTEEKVQQQTAGSPDTPTAAPSPAKTSPPPDDSAVEEKGSPPTQPAEAATPSHNAAPADAGTVNVQGADERQVAQTIQTQHAEPEELALYARSLSKKIQENLVYPSRGRHAGIHGTVTVSFTIMASGQIRMDTLKVVGSSGEPLLDDNALKSVRSSSPFRPPPEEMTIAIAVEFARKQ